jgi:hypothetical protein
LTGLAMIAARRESRAAMLENCRTSRAMIVAHQMQHRTRMHHARVSAVPSPLSAMSIAMMIGL